MNEPNNLVLLMLRRMDEKLDKTLDRLDELTRRVGGVETEMAQMHVRVAEL